MIAVFLLAVAGLTKSAQAPFSKWLMGAMAAPTPSSALLHSSTMVKAGVYLIIRLSPMLGATVPGVTVTLVGGFTFFVAACLAVTRSDAKKILAYSTISNLGLIVACAGVDTEEALWAAIMLIVFHAVAKSLMFLTVGSTEYQLGSRNVEDMEGLTHISTPLAMLLIIGVAGMFIAPFGMLISKWAAMKAFVDSGNVLIVLLISFGSTVTLFFWTKWLGKIVSNAHRSPPTDYKMRNDERASLFSLAALVVVLCLLHPLVSDYFVAPFLGDSFVSPMTPLNTALTIGMLCMLFLLPVALIPVYRFRRVKLTSTYLSGENAGDDESFTGAFGEARRVELRNWYMRGVVREGQITRFSCALAAVALALGFFIVIGGVLF
jgi:ech hydrogenase subunit A